MKRKKAMQNKAAVKYIDKTGQLEEGISRFPSVYIEGNAAVGKSVAVRMFLEKHSEMPHCLFDFLVELRMPEELLKKLSVLKARMEQEKLWLVLENMPEILDAEVVACLKEMLHTMKSENRLFFVSRSKPQIEFLQLLWANEMCLLPMRKLLFSQEEIRSFFRRRNISLNAKQVYEKTGGWPGCVAVLAQLSEINKEKSVEELLKSYEIRQYIQCEIIEQLTREERRLLSYIAGCPWVNEKFLEDVWKIEETRERLEELERKGLLAYERGKNRWKLTALFENHIAERLPVTGEEHAWYEHHKYIVEMFSCLEKSGEEKLYQEYLQKYYRAIYSQGLISKKLLNRKGNTPQDCYLRGIYYYTTQQFKKLQKEIEIVRNIENKDFAAKEVLLNLSYIDPQVSLEQWLELLETLLEDGRKFQMYQMFGNSVTYLCGIRDLSGLFACSVKEEKRKARLWKKAFGENEWKGYQLARMDYYLETERKDFIPEEDWDLMRNKEISEDLWQVRLSKLYLLCKMQRMQYDERYNERIEVLEHSLMEESDPICADLTECISNFYAPWYGAKEKMSRWLRYASTDSTVAITEENYVMLYCQAKGYMILNQFDRAEKILKKLMPYLKTYRRSRFLTEALFQYAIINQAKGFKGQALKNVIESFLHYGNSRYVFFYSGYGKKGQEVLEEYIEWQKAGAPERWSHKKKYNYGNVLRMTQEDYLDAVLRNAKRVSRNEKIFSEEYIEERLTMTETLVLQDIGRGLSNQEICVELGVKMSTVKGHIYNLYKKLGVKSRGQAIVKGKELGVLE